MLPLNDNHDRVPLVSLVIPCYNEAEVFGMLRKELIALAESLSGRYRVEFIFVDDGSSDTTWGEITAFASKDARVRAVSLSRNFGHQMALTCGYDLAHGEAIISLDADLQDPPEVVVDLIGAWEKGADIVYAVRSKREGEGLFKRLTARIFYGLFAALGRTQAPVNSGDFRLISKRSVAAFRQLREQHRYIRGMVGWIGFKTANVEYERKPRPAGTTKYPLSRMLRLALDAIVSFSFFPLRLAYFFALLASSIILGYLAYVLVKFFFFGVSLVPGWASLLACVTMFGFLSLLCQGIMGEYIGRIYEQSKYRPLYLIRETAEKTHCDNSEPQKGPHAEK